MNKKKTLFICLGILLVGGAVIAFVFLTEPSASRSGATKESAMLVEVEQVKQGSFKPTIVATGTVQPAKDIVLSARVSGEVIRLSDAFIFSTAIILLLVPCLYMILEDVVSLVKGKKSLG